MIKSWRGKFSQAIFDNEAPRGFPPDVLASARRKLKIINAATTSEDLNTPPGNKLEALTGDREGQHSIRVNDKWRVCFRWEPPDAFDVEIIDYH